MLPGSPLTGLREYDQDGNAVVVDEVVLFANLDERGISGPEPTAISFGFEGRFDYGAVGNVVILASRLSDSAAPGEILISQRLNAAVEADYATEPADDQALKGFSRPVPAFRVLGLKA